MPPSAGRERSIASSRPTSDSGGERWQPSCGLFVDVVTESWPRGPRQPDRSSAAGVAPFVRATQQAPLRRRGRWLLLHRCGAGRTVRRHRGSLKRFPPHAGGVALATNGHLTAQRLCRSLGRVHPAQKSRWRDPVGIEWFRPPVDRDTVGRFGLDSPVRIVSGRDSTA
jgi:hypothetical protein